MHRTALFFFQAEDGIRDLVRSRGLGDVYKRQLTDVGRKRRHNEDAYLLDAERGLFVVADGMGGHLSLIHI